MKLEESKLGNTIVNVVLRKQNGLGRVCTWITGLVSIYMGHTVCITTRKGMNACTRVMLIVVCLITVYANEACFEAHSSTSATHGALSEERGTNSTWRSHCRKSEGVRPCVDNLSARKRESYGNRNSMTWVFGLKNYNLIVGILFQIRGAYARSPPPAPPQCTHDHMRTHVPASRSPIVHTTPISSMSHSHHSAATPPSPHRPPYRSWRRVSMTWVGAVRARRIVRDHHDFDAKI